MDTIKDITILNGIVHVLDTNGDRPILNEYVLELTEDVYTFLFNHVKKILSDNDLRQAKFLENNLVKNAVYRLAGNKANFIEVSTDLANKLFVSMKEKVQGEACDLVVVEIATEYGPLIGLLELSYVQNFTHSINFVEEKIGINIVSQKTSLPSNKSDRAAFIRMNVEEDSECELYIYDKNLKVSKKKSANISPYFTEHFLRCEILDSARDVTRTLLESTDNFIKTILKNKPAASEKLASVVKEYMQNEDTINIEDISEDAFSGELSNLKESFSNYVSSSGIDTSSPVEIDKEFIENKFKKIKLKLNDSINITLPEDIYSDPNQFQIVKNSDDTINITIRGISSFINS